MASMRPDLIMPDERAAGVISGSDPYRELELYLEKVNEEFGEVFERWLGSSEQSTINHNGNLKPSQILSSAAPEDGFKNLCNGNQKKMAKDIKPTDIHGLYYNSCRTRSLPSKTKTGKNVRDANNIYAFVSEKTKAFEKEWSEGLMAEFNKLIASELSQLKIDIGKEAEEKKNAKDSSASPDSDSSGSMRSDSTIGSLKRNPKTFRRSFSDGPDVAPRKQNGNAVLIKVSPLEEVAPRSGSDSNIPRKRIPSPVKIREFFRSTSPFGKRGKKEFRNSKLPDEGFGSYRSKKLYVQDTDIPPPAPSKRKKNNSEKIPLGLQNLLNKIRPTGPRCKSPKEITGDIYKTDTSPGEMEDFLDAILSSVSTATQTSPALSRSSSFTWMSDCSSSIVLNTPGSLSDVNDEKSSSSGRSSSSPARLQCENGCGSECDCGTSGSRDSCGESPDSGDQQESAKEGSKLKRKETWEKIRRRHSELLRLGRKSYSGDIDVWVRRESVHTQTQEEGDTDRENVYDDATENVSKWLEVDRFEDKLQGLPPRPKNDSKEQDTRSFPLEKSKSPRPQNLSNGPMTMRSLPCPTEYKNQPSSPSTVSLKLLGAAMSPDLGNKSSSAPVIMKQAITLKKDVVKPEEVAKKLILKQPRSQSERHLAEVPDSKTDVQITPVGLNNTTPKTVTAV